MINHTDENNNPEIQCKFGDNRLPFLKNNIDKHDNLRHPKANSVITLYPLSSVAHRKLCGEEHPFGEKGRKQ